jgi:large repetitive protein
MTPLDAMKCIFSCEIVLVFFLIPFGVKAQVLETATLRFGNGIENSVNTSGNLQQPFYWDAGTSQFYKLTYSSYPLDIAVAWGGDGANEWNINGTIVETDNGSYDYNGQVIDASGYISTGADSGYGTIISTGTVTINGADLQIRNTYTLTQTDAFISINTEVTNLTAGPLGNVRVWVGTRDDYVGTDDGPEKQRGNLVDGAFEQIANATDRSTALLITADSGAATPGVLFYTTAPNANASVNRCCAFSNAYQQDPATSAIVVSPGADGSYAMYVRMPDLAAGASSDFTWYYAAGDISLINDIIADVAAASSSVSNITYTTADLAATLTADSTGYWLLGRSASRFSSSN